MGTQCLFIKITYMDNQHWTKAWFIENLIITPLILLILGGAMILWRTEYVVLAVTLGVLGLFCFFALILHKYNKKK